MNLSESRAEITSDALYAFIVERGGGITWAEIVRWAGDAGRGSFAVQATDNVLFYAGMSEALCDAIDGLGGRVYIGPCSVLTYLIDGGMLRLPVVKRIPKEGYRSEHWIPTVFWAPSEWEHLPPKEKKSAVLWGKSKSGMHAGANGALSL